MQRAHSYVTIAAFRMTDVLHSLSIADRSVTFSLSLVRGVAVLCLAVEMTVSALVHVLQMMAQILFVSNQTSLRLVSAFMFIPTHIDSSMLIFSNTRSICDYSWWNDKR